ncbi:MAG: glycoside hydrolase [Lentisphaerae bacterium]|nr:glycoside hydrolase [Lentisphaerota bacterium]
MTIGSHYLLENNDDNGLRDGEGSVARLADGSLLMAYSHFLGPSDASPAELVIRRSIDNGQSWTDRQTLFQPPPEALNIMSASLLPLQDGHLACIYLLKWTASTHLIPYFCTSSDSGKTWSAPLPITDEEGYFVVNNDRLIQMASGRLVLPAAHHRRTAATTRTNPDYSNAYCGCFLSDDGGATWRKSRDWKRYQKANWLEPAEWDRAQPAVAEKIQSQQNVLQEPGVVDVGHGRLFAWARSQTHIYRSWSEDGGDTWQEFTALPDFPVPCSPASVKPLPDGSGLLMVYNDRQGVAFGAPEWKWRTPLACAVSHDGGQTWRKIRDLEPDSSRNYCYTSLLLEPEQCLATYYVSAEKADAPQAGRRNLASLRVHRFHAVELFQK